MALQVADFRQDTMEVRMLVSAGNAGKVFDLRCDVRERMIAWLRADHPEALPRRQAEVDTPPGGAPPGARQPRPHPVAE